MPEYGPRAQKYYGLNFRVENCPIIGADNSKDLWTPTRSTPIAPAVSSVYVGHPEDGGHDYCAIRNGKYGGKGVCEIDDRISLEKSTELAIVDFQEPWKDKKLAASGAAIQTIIMSHNAGWDARKFGAGRKGGNMKPTYDRWSKKVNKSKLHTFYGANLVCKKSDPKEECLKRSKILPRVQHYGYPIIAQHWLAVCFYGANYPEESPIFREYQKEFVGSGKFCNQLKIKTPKEL